MLTADEAANMTKDAVQLETEVDALITYIDDCILDDIRCLNPEQFSNVLIPPSINPHAIVAAIGRLSAEGYRIHLDHTVVGGLRIEWGAIEGFVEEYIGLANCRKLMVALDEIVKLTAEQGSSDAEASFADNIFSACEVQYVMECLINKGYESSVKMTATEFTISIGW